MSFSKTLVKWPRFLTPTHLSQMIRKQKNPLSALEIFNEAKTRYPGYSHDGPSYAAMINILGNSRRFLEMKHVIQQMTEDYCQFKDSAFNKIIRLYCSAGLIDEAVELFDRIPQFNCVKWTDSFNTLLQIVIQKGDLGTAYRLYVENSNRWEVNAQVRSFNMLIAALCRIKRSDLALIIFEEMNRQCCFPDRDTYRMLMKGLCEEGKLEVATHLLYSMFWRISRKGCGADIVVYRILLEALCDQQKFEEANNILNKVLKKGLKAPKNYYPKLDIAGEFAAGRNSEDIKGMVNDALVKCGVPSLASHSAMITDFYSEGKIEEGNSLLDEMRQRGYRANTTLYETKIKALCGQGRVDEAADVLDREMLEGNCVPTTKTYKIVIGNLCKKGKSRKAVGYLEKMGKRVGCLPDKEIYGALVDGLCTEGKFVEASGVLGRILDSKYWPCDDTFSSIIKGLCGMGRLYEAVLWLEEMISLGKTPDVSVWNSLVGLSSHAESVELSRETIERLTLHYITDPQFKNSAVGITGELTVSCHCFK